MQGGTNCRTRTCHSVSESNARVLTCRPPQLCAHDLALFVVRATKQMKVLQASSTDHGMVRCARPHATPMLRPGYPLVSRQCSARPWRTELHCDRDANLTRPIKRFTVIRSHRHLDSQYARMSRHVCWVLQATVLTGAALRLPAVRAASCCQCAVHILECEGRLCSQAKP